MPAPDRRPSLIEKLFTLPPSAIEDRARRRMRPTVKWLLAAVPVLFIAALLSALGTQLLDVLSQRPVTIEPRHRAEALCLALAMPPRFAPSLTVTPSAALVRTDLPPQTPPAIVLQQRMGFTDAMVLRAATERVGDYELATLWLRIPGETGTHLWLIVCWMEGTELAVSNFRFAGDASVLSPEHERWGNRILERVLVGEFFRAGELPNVKLRVPPDRTSMPVFGPAS